MTDFGILPGTTCFDTVLHLRLQSQTKTVSSKTFSGRYILRLMAGVAQRWFRLNTDVRTRCRAFEDSGFRCWCSRFGRGSEDWSAASTSAAWHFSICTVAGIVPDQLFHAKIKVLHLEPTPPHPKETQAAQQSIKTTTIFPAALRTAYNTKPKHHSIAITTVALTMTVRSSNSNSSKNNSINNSISVIRIIKSIVIV